MARVEVEWVDPLLPAPEEIVYARTAAMLSHTYRDSHVTRRGAQNAEYH